MKVLGLMTCFNRKEKTLNSIRKIISENSDILFEFIVVDDASKDGTKEALEKEFSNVTVLSGNGGLYYSGGMRMAISYVKSLHREYDYILLFNDDVDFYYNSIYRLIEYKGTDDIAVGATENSKNIISYGGVRKKSSFRPAFSIFMSSHERKEYCDTFNANCVIIDFDVFCNLDNIDPVYGHSLGDYDYGLNASRMGYKICVSDFFVGRCENNPVSDNWLDTSKSRLERLKKKESIKGLPLKTWFHFVSKNFGIVPAIISTCNQYIKIVINK